ncbi:TlpA disulfide reductase family protein [Porticoccus sp. W117]|uniref:TlpA disulfide reductase family protein n=1 Tax=Porticoccus sp. W117 TaxID=3054777 RepID=UPI002596F2CA|nr:TlpA disulfide reductase family protein [Porticoccus sp. W117]MDM3869936.1 TlpA disulfide reductase family protein [Porticoccus sp. W117]
MNKFFAFTASLAFLIGGCNADTNAGQQASNSAAEAPSQSGSYTLSGDLSSRYVSGDLVIWVNEPKQKAKAATMSSMAAATTATKAAKPAKATKASSGAVAMGAAMSMSAPADDSALYNSLNVVAEAKLEDGRFTLSGEVDEVRQVYFYVLNARSKSGARLAPTKGQGFILEPGNLTMSFDENSTFAVTGGTYNDAVYNSWKLSPEYRDTKAEMNRLYRSVDGESEEQKRARLDAAAEAQHKMLNLETEGRKTVAMTHPDVLARKLAIQTAWLGGRWMLQSAYQIREMAPQDAWVHGYIAKQEAYYAKRDRNESIAKVGGDIKDFDAETLAGKTVSLKDVRGKNKYVLLEFWASWCGPCRAEIPHMKKAYEEYNAKGFEIFSFTIDDDKDAWADASEEEQMPWIDTGFGSESEPTVLYEVTGVPANYLVDGETGKVVARNLRGHKLDEKLEELLK